MRPIDEAFSEYLYTTGDKSEAAKLMRADAFYAAYNMQQAEINKLQEKLNNILTEIGEADHGLRTLLANLDE